MGIYINLEQEFIERTIKLIDQYTRVCNDFPFDEQYNYTLTINCLLGLIVMPKEKVISYVPTTRLTKDFKTEIGLTHSEIWEGITTMRELITSLRNSIAHFNINVISENDENLIDYIEFRNSDIDQTIARFRASEMLAFLKYYSNCLLENLRNHRN